MADTNPVGRPSSRTPEVIATLIASFQNGLNITQSCLQAGISDTTFDNWRKDDPDFLEKMEIAQNYASMKSRQNIITAINRGDEYNSRWWLERKDKEFKPKNDITTKDESINTPDPEKAEAYAEYLRNRQ